MFKVAEVYGANCRNALFGHINPINGIYSRHGQLVMGNNNKLRFLGKFLDNIVEFRNIGVIQWSIYLIENTEGCGFEKI